MKLSVRGTGGSATSLDASSSSNNDITGYVGFENGLLNSANSTTNFSDALGLNTAATDWWTSDNIGVTYKNLEVFDNNLTDEQVSDFIKNKLP